MTTESQLRRAMEGVTTTASKVLSAVPIQEQWTREQIVAELRRSGQSLAVNVIHGCLDNLRGRGLITEPASGRFIRVTAKPRPIATNDEAIEDDMPPPTKPAAVTTELPALGRLADLAQRARNLASEMEDVALEVQQQIDTISSKSAKLQQLAALLKEVA